MSVRRWWLLGGAALLVIAFGVGLVVMLAGRETPEQAAQAWADAFNNKDFASVYELSCREAQQRRGRPPPIDDGSDRTGDTLTVVIDKVEQKDDTSAVAAIHLEFNGKSLGVGGQPLDAGAPPFMLKLVKEDGHWKECSES